jgi:hypothetical protein
VISYTTHMCPKMLKSEGVRSLSFLRAPGASLLAFSAEGPRAALEAIFVAPETCCKVAREKFAAFYKSIHLIGE